MFTTILFFLPCLVSALWFFSYVLKSRTARQQFYMWLLAVEVFFYAFYAVYLFPDAEYNILVMMSTVGMPLTLVVLGMVTAYLHMLRMEGKPKIHYWLLMSPALGLACILNILYYIIGIDDTALITRLIDSGATSAVTTTSAARAYIFFSTHVFNLCCFGFFIIAGTQCVRLVREQGYRPGNVWRFFFRHAQATPHRVIAILLITQLAVMLPIITLGRTFMIHHVVIGAILSILVAIIKHCVCHVEYYSHIPFVTLSTLTNVMDVSRPKSYDDDALDYDDDDENVSLNPHEEHEHDVDDATHIPTLRAKKLTQELHKLIDEEKIYLDDSLTLATLAERLGTGRTTLSSLVSQEYGMPFRDVINHLRIEEAKRLLLLDSSLPQEALAFKCGFKEASSLSRKFREIEGCPPLLWLTKQR